MTCGCFIDVLTPEAMLLTIFSTYSFTFIGDWIDGNTVDAYYTIEILMVAQFYDYGIVIFVL